VLAGPHGGARMNALQIGTLGLDRCSTVVLAACGTARGRIRAL